MRSHLRRLATVGSKQADARRILSPFTRPRPRCQNPSSKFGAPHSDLPQFAMLDFQLNPAPEGGPGGTSLIARKREHSPPPGARESRGFPHWNPLARWGHGAAPGFPDSQSESGMLERPRATQPKREFEKDNFRQKTKSQRSERVSRPQGCAAHRYSASGATRGTAQVRSTARAAQAR
jgi:hypothetical protein